MEIIIINIKMKTKYGTADGGELVKGDRVGKCYKSDNRTRGEERLGLGPVTTASVDSWSLERVLEVNRNEVGYMSLRHHPIGRTLGIRLTFINM